MKWKELRVGRVTASRFGNVLLRKSPPTESFVSSFLNTSHNPTTPTPINHGFQNEVKLVMLIAQTQALWYVHVGWWLTYLFHGLVHLQMA